MRDDIPIYSVNVLFPAEKAHCSYFLFCHFYRRFLIYHMYAPLSYVRFIFPKLTFHSFTLFFYIYATFIQSSFFIVFFSILLYLHSIFRKLICIVFFFHFIMYTLIYAKLTFHSFLSPFYYSTFHFPKAHFYSFLSTFYYVYDSITQSSLFIVSFSISLYLQFLSPKLTLELSFFICMYVHLLKALI